MNAIEILVAKWAEPNGIPYKGDLISDDGCMCAQGQALHYIGGLSAEDLRKIAQSEADRMTAALLGISRAHAVLLRHVNDGQPGAPSVVLTDPARVVGDQAETVLAFWRHLDRMTQAQWAAAKAAAWAAAVAAAGAAAGSAAEAAAEAAAGSAAWSAAVAAAGSAAEAAAEAAAGSAAGSAAWSAAGSAAEAAAGSAAWSAAEAAAEAAAGSAAWSAAGSAAEAAAVAAAWAAAGSAAGASGEIQGAAIMRTKGQPFTFLPMFGFSDPEAVLATEAAQ